MKEEKYKLEKAITTNNSNCENCKTKKNCPYKDKSECFEYNNSSLTKGAIEDDLNHV